MGHFSTFWKLRSQTRKKPLKKSKNVFCKCVLDFNFAPIKGSVFFIFYKKKIQIRCTLVYNNLGLFLWKKWSILNRKWMPNGTLRFDYKRRLSFFNRFVRVWLRSSQLSQFGILKIIYIFIIFIIIIIYYIWKFRIYLKLHKITF